MIRSRSVPTERMVEHPRFPPSERVSVVGDEEVRSDPVQQGVDVDINSLPRRHSRRSGPPPIDGLANERTKRVARVRVASGRLAAVIKTHREVVLQVTAPGVLDRVPSTPVTLIPCWRRCQHSAALDDDEQEKQIRNHPYPVSLPAAHTSVFLTVELGLVSRGLARVFIYVALCV